MTNDAPLWEPTRPQQLMLDHLRARPVGALFVGCGLGKTAACLQHVCDLLADGATDGVLVVAPVRVVNLTWPAEARKWRQFRPLRMVSLREEAGWAALEEGSADVYLINYELLPRLQERHLFNRRRLSFDTVIFDELTRAKSPTSKRINRVRKYFLRHCPRRYGLTGTPSPNSLLDLFAQARLLDGGEALGKSFSRFRRQYFYPVDYYERKWVPRDGSREAIYDRLKGLALVLRSSDWLNIPDMAMEDVAVPLHPSARLPYQELQDELFTVVEQDAVVVANSAALVNKLLQVTSGALYTEGGRWRRLHPGKLNALERVLKQLHNTPTIVLVQYQHEQARIAERFPTTATLWAEAGSPAAQTELAARWNAGKVPLLVAHPASLGHGLNLQDVEGGSAIVWFTLPWSRELYDQANARIARMGQRSVTRCLRLITSDTVEEAVAESLRTKDAEQNTLLRALENYFQK